jgi:hypothetical protein
VRLPPAADIKDQHPDVETRQQLEDIRHKLEDDREDACPSEPPTARSHHIYVEFHAPTGMVYMDPTGKFLQPSSTGNSYILVVYDYDGNYIDAIAMKNQKGPAIVIAYKIAHQFLECQGFKPLLQCLDNEASQALQYFMAESNIDFQLAPPPIPLS